MKAKVKQSRLEAYLRKKKRVAVAFSGGVDSTYLLYVAHEILGDNVLAVTLDTPFVPVREITAAKAFCEKEGICQRMVTIPLSSLESVRGNPVNRCYLCKRQLFEAVWQVVKQAGISVVLDGTNAEDGKVFRPGLQALRELGIESPLQAMGLDKKDIRELSKAVALPTGDKPSFSCLATRFPYGESLTTEKLNRVEQGENFLFDYGFHQVRVRAMGTTARIEVWPEEMERLFHLRKEVAQAFRGIGFVHVSMDLMGFRSGSMDEGRIE